MRLKIIIHYQNNQTENIVLFTKPHQTIEDLCNYLSKTCHIQTPQIWIEGFRALNDQIVENLVTNDEIIQIIEGIGSSNKMAQKETKVRQKQIIQNQESSSEEDDKQVQKKQPLIQDQNLKTQHIKSNLIVQPGQFSSKSSLKIKPNIQRITSETESSSQDVPIKKPQTANKQSIVISTPGDELKNKQEEWKKTFIKSSQKTTEQSASQQNKFNVKCNPIQSNTLQNPVNQTQEKKSQQIGQTTQNTKLNEYVKLPILSIKDDPTLIEKNDEVLFKYNYLDIEKCQPTVSKLLQGKVQENLQQDKKLIIKTKQSDILQIYYSEIQEFQINLATIQSSTRKLAIKVLSQDVDSQQQQQQQQQLVLDESGTNNNNISQQQKEVIDPFGIGQQINYYYSDKNYFKDDFILQHSAQDPEKFMLFKLLLNFPKVKSKIKSEDELLDIVELFLRKTQQDLVNFEIKKNNEGLYMIRKKLIQ